MTTAPPLGKHGPSAAGGRSRRRGLAAALVAGLVLSALPGSAQTPKVPDPPAAIEIQAQRLAGLDHGDPSRRRFGMLEFRGGLRSRRAQGVRRISAIRVQPTRAFHRCDRQGWWLRGRITPEGKRPTGVADAEMAAILGPDGLSLASRRWYDTESIAQDGGTLYVGIGASIGSSVRLRQGRPPARGQPIDVPPRVRSLRRTTGS